MTRYHAHLEVNSFHNGIGSKDTTENSRLTESDSKCLHPLSHPTDLQTVYATEGKLGAGQMLAPIFLPLP